MSVITIFSEKGSQGGLIANTVAQSLGYVFIDGSVIARVRTEYGCIAFGGLPTVNVLNKVILALAHYDNVVILGHSAFDVLAEFADVLNVRIQAPLPVRTKYVMQQQKLAESELAESLVIESDRLHAAFIERFYHGSNTCQAFDVVMDTGKMSNDLAVSLITQSVKLLPHRMATNVPTTNTIEVDTDLSDIVIKTIERDCVGHNY